MKLIPPALALVWGLIWAALLQFTQLGRFLAARRTWLTVVIGVGVDLALLRGLLSLRDWLRVVGIIALSSIGIIGRSLVNEARDHREFLTTVRGLR